MSESDPAHDPLARLCAVTAATMRALAGRADIPLPFAPDPVGPGIPDARTAEPDAALAGDALARFRGDADAVALRLRLHDPALHARLAPAGGDARAAFDALEQLRVEALGAIHMRGVAANLRAAAQARWHTRWLDAAHGRDTAHRGDTAPVADLLALLARERLTGDRCWPRAADGVIDRWRTRLDASVERRLDRLVDAVADQDRFGEQVRLLLSEAELDDACPPKIESSGGAPEPDCDRPDDTPRDERAIDAASVEPDAAPTRALESSAPLAGRDEEHGTEAAPQGPAPAAVQSAPAAACAPPSRYRPFTTAHDEVVTPGDLRDRGELLRLRALLDALIAASGRATSRDAARLQRQLLASTPRGWDFELEAGLLDTARLVRTIVAPDNARIYKSEREERVPETTVTLLVDNSGSMRGRPIALAAMTADIVARTLERCGIGTEILGFTTRAWKGGRSRKDWVAQGRPPAPGRLTDLRHVVYKSAGTPWRRARVGLALMLDEGLLKENVDGEALLWAHARLLARPERRRILMVVSDGAPLDDSTTCTNAPDYLERHLREVIAWIERLSLVELTAIGICHDVSRHYRRALTLDDAEQLGSAVIRELGALFSPSRSSGNRGSELSGRPRHGPR